MEETGSLLNDGSMICALLIRDMELMISFDEMPKGTVFREGDVVKGNTALLALAGPCGILCDADGNLADNSEFDVGKHVEIPKKHSHSDSEISKINALLTMDFGRIIPVNGAVIGLTFFKGEILNGVEAVVAIEGKHGVFCDEFGRPIEDCDLDILDFVEYG